MANPSSGSGQVVWQQALGLASLNWDVHLVCPLPGPKRLAVTESLPLTVHSIKCSTIPSRDLGEYASGLVNDFRIPLVIGHGLSGLELFKRVNRKQRRFRAVAHIQHLIAGEICALLKHRLLLLDGIPRNFGRILALTLEYALTKSDVDSYLVPSRFTAQELALVYHQPPAKAIVLPNSVDTSVFHPRFELAGTHVESSPKHPLLILYVGRLEARKGVTTLLHAFALVRKKRGDARLIMVGDGPARRQVELLAKGLYVDSEVDLVKGLSTGDLAQLYRDARIVVIPSLYEGFGLVLLEALASRAQVVPTDIAPFKEIADEFPCRFVPPGNALELARCIEDSLVREQEPTASEEAYQRLVHRYNSSNIAKQLEIVLRSLPEL